MFLIWGLISAVAALGVVRLEIDNATASFLDRSDSAWQVYQQSLVEFGGDEILVIAIEGDSPFDPKVLARVRELSSEFSVIPGVWRVDSISTVPVIWTAPDGSIDFDPAVGELDIATHLDRTIERLRHDRIASNSLVSEDGRVFAINLILDDDVDVGRPSVVAEVASRLLHDRAWLSGVPVFRTEVNSRTRDELALFVPVTLFLVGAVVFVGFARLYAVIVALSTSLFGTWVILGAMGALGTRLSLSTMILPSVLLALGCAYVMHVLTAARGVEGRVELERAISGVVKPIGLSGLTTAIGFLAISTIRIDAIRELGTFGAVGVIAVLAAALTTAPAALSLRPIGDGGATLDTWLRGTARGIVMNWVSHKRLVLVLWSVAVLASGIGLTRLSIETDIILWFSPDSDVRKSYDAIRTRLSGITPMNVVVRSTDGRPLTQPDRLAAIDALTSTLNGMPQIGKAISVTDPLRQLHDGFVGHRNSDLLNDYSQIEQYLLLLDSLTRMRDVISSDRNTANILLRVDENGSRSLMALAEEIDSWWAIHGVPGVVITTTGIMYEFGRAEEEIAYGQLRGLGLAFALVGGILLAIFRSPRLAFAAMLPNIVPLLITYGLMGLAGIPLDAATVCLGSLALGIAVDDTIHLATRFRDFRQSGQEAADALDSALRVVLPALVFTTVGIALGFAVLALSEFTLVRNLGMVTAFLVVLCLLADITLLPALLVRRGTMRSWARDRDR